MLCLRKKKSGAKFDFREAELCAPRSYLVCDLSANISGVRLAVGKGRTRLVVLLFSSLGKLFQPLWGKKRQVHPKNEQFAIVLSEETN